MPADRFGRRSFLFAAAGLVASHRGRRLWADGRPQVSAPRATDGDAAHEPNWDEQITLTVGVAHGDLVGESDKVLQAAVDYVARLGGGTVRVLPGTYTLRNAVFLPSGVRLQGSGADSVITKIASETVPLSADSDWYDQEVTLQSARGFQVGDGVVLRTTDPDNGGPTVIKRTLTARSGNRFKLNDGLRKNLWLTGKPTCASLFPLLTSEYTSDVVIENLTLDGNGQNNERLDGNYGGCVFLQDCNRYTLRNVTTRNYHGDGISFQICHDVVVEECHSHDNTDLGLHPGSGSQRPVIRGNRLERNDQGLFWCWGVRYGLAEKNQMLDNRSYGISIGHSDTDNVMRNNLISGSGQIGILFRDDPRGQDFWPNRNVVEKNRIQDSGGDDGIAIDIRGQTRDLQILENELTESRGPKQRVGVRIAAEAGAIELAKNTLAGFATDVLDLRSAGTEAGANR